eukprot:2685361-Rhodomonas_salina.4
MRLMGLVFGLDLYVVRAGFARVRARLVRFRVYLYLDVGEGDAAAAEAHHALDLIRYVSTAHRVG